MSTNDDDWEAAVNLSKLQLKPPDTEKDEEEDAPSSVAPPMVVKPGVGDLAATAARPAQTDAPVDDSLMSALTNPRERGHVLQIERLVFEFAQTAEPAFNVPPLANSFQRLLVYRIAQRFNIGHQTSDVFYVNGERGITLFRTQSTFTPKTLLVDVLEQTLAAEAANTPPNVVRENPAIAKGKKVKVMKRSTSGSGIDKKDKNAGKRTETLDDKEKAYEVARARIFGLDGGSEATSSSAPSPSSETAAESPAIPTDSMTDVPRAGSGKGSPVVQGGDSPTPVAAAEKSNQPPPQTRRQGGRGKGKNVDTTSWTGNKSITRDRFAEQSDPDFTRNRQFGGPGHYSHQGYPPPPHYGAPPMGQGQYAPPHGYGDYGMPMAPQPGYDPRHGGYVNSNVYGQPQPPGFGGFPPRPPAPDGMYYEGGGPYAPPPGARRATPPMSSSNRSPPPADFNSNFPPLG